MHTYTHRNRQCLITAVHVFTEFAGPSHLSHSTWFMWKLFAAINTHSRIYTETHTVPHRIYDSGAAAPRGYWTFSSVINVSVLIDDLYCNYLLKGRNRIIRKGLEGRKVLIQWEFWGGNWNAEGDKVHRSPQNSVSANGKEEGRICRRNQWSQLMAY